MSLREKIAQLRETLTAKLDALDAAVGKTLTDLQRRVAAAEGVLGATLSELDDIKSRLMELEGESTWASNAIFDFSAGDISPSEWDAFLLRLPKNERTGRAEASSFNVRNGIDSTIGRFVAGDGFEVPTMHLDGSINAFARADQHNPHNMLMIANRDGRFHPQHPAYVPHNVPFELQMTLSLPDPIQSYQGKRWLLVWQLHPGSFPQAWADRTNMQPQLSLVLVRRQWRVEHRGSLSAAPTKFDHETLGRSVEVPAGKQNIRIRWLQDYTGTDSYVQVVINGDQIYESKRTNAINHSGLGAGVGASLLTVGNYRSGEAPEYPDVTVEKVKLLRG